MSVNSRLETKLCADPTPTAPGLVMETDPGQKRASGTFLGVVMTVSLPVALGEGLPTFV